MSKFNQLSTSLDRIKQSAEKASSGGKKDDPRFLNYYNLADEDQSIVVRFLPVNESGDIFLDYHIHQHKDRSIPTVACAYRSSNQDCPVCSAGWDAYQAGDKTTSMMLKSQEKILAQVVVVHSDIPIAVSDDGNMVKLMHVPFAIRDEVLKQINNGLITGDLMEVDFVIKRAIGKNKQPHYKNSFFKPNGGYSIPQEFIDSFDAGNSYLYDMTKEVPAATTTADMQEWLDKVNSLGNGDQGGSTSPKSSLSSIVKNASAPADDTPKTEAPAPAADEAVDVTAKTSSSTSSSELLDLLNNR